MAIATAPPYSEGCGIGRDSEGRRKQPPGHNVNLQPRRHQLLRTGTFSAGSGAVLTPYDEVGELLLPIHSQARPNSRQGRHPQLQARGFMQCIKSLRIYSCISTHDHYEPPTK